MIVTKIEKKKSKVTVTFDNDDILIIPYDLFLKNTLFVDDKITNKQKENLEEKVELYKIKQSSFVYLSGRNHSKNELKLKLLKKRYNKHLVDIVLSELEQLNYLDDKEFAKQFFNSRLKKNKGIKLIKSELAKKGVHREIVEEIALSFVDDPRIEESIKVLSEKKLKSLLNKNLTKIQIKQKIFHFLLNKGYAPDLIKETIYNLKLE